MLAESLAQSLIGQKSQQIGQARHVEKLHGGPFPAVGFTVGRGDGTHAHHGKNVENEQRKSRGGGINGFSCF